MEHQEGEPLNQIDIYSMMPATVGFIQRVTELAIVFFEPVLKEDYIIGLRFHLVELWEIVNYSDVLFRYVFVSVFHGRVFIGFEDEVGYLSPQRHSIDAMKLEYMRVCELVQKYGFEY